MTTPQTQHRMPHRVLVVGGGTAGITVAAGSAAPTPNWNRTLAGRA